MGYNKTNVFVSPLLNVKVTNKVSEVYKVGDYKCQSTRYTPDKQSMKNSVLENKNAIKNVIEKGKGKHSVPVMSMQEYVEEISRLQKEDGCINMARLTRFIVNQGKTTVACCIISDVMLSKVKLINEVFVDNKCVNVFEYDYNTLEELLEGIENADD